MNLTKIWSCASIFGYIRSLKQTSKKQEMDKMKKLLEKLDCPLVLVPGDIIKATKVQGRSCSLKIGLGEACCGVLRFPIKKRFDLTKA